MPLIDRIRLRRDTAANWTAADPVLALGEPGLETDMLKWKVGDGVTLWSALPYWNGGVGGGGISGADEFPFPVPANQWVVNHNKGRPVLTALQTLGGAELSAEVVHTSTNQCQVNFSSPAAGRVLII